LNLIESINLLKKNKRYFGPNDDYLKILINLYNEISEKNLSNHNFDFKDLDVDLKNIKFEDFGQEEKNKLFDEILKSFNFDSILKIKNIDKLIFINPLFELFYVENNLIQFNPDKKFQIQSEPIIGSYNKQNIADLMKVIMWICQKSVDCKNKIIQFIILYDIIFKNFQFILDNKNLRVIVKHKLDELKQHEKVNDICTKYNLEKNFVEKWCEVFDSVDIE
jgi:hypothetical protein